MLSIVADECKPCNSIIHLMNYYGEKLGYSSGDNVLSQGSLNATLANKLISSYLDQESEEANAPGSFNTQNLLESLSSFDSFHDPSPLKQSSIASVTSVLSESESECHYVSQNLASGNFTSCYTGIDSTVVCPLIHINESQIDGKIESSLDDPETDDEVHQFSNEAAASARMFPAEFLDLFDQKFLEETHVRVEQFEKYICDEIGSEYEHFNLNFSTSTNFDRIRYEVERKNLLNGVENPKEKSTLCMKDKSHNSTMILHLEEVLLTDQFNAKIWYNLGVAHYMNGSDRMAIAAYKNSLDVSPNFCNALLNISISLANESMNMKALQFLHCWLVNHGIYGTKSTMLSFEQSRSFYEVKCLFDAASSLQPEKGDIHFLNALSVLHCLNHGYIRALDCLRSALSIEPNDVILKNRYGAVLLNAGFPREALDVFLTIQAMKPDYGRVHSNLAIAYFEMGETNSAIQQLLRAIEIQEEDYPTDSSASNFLWSTLQLVVFRSEDLDELNLQAVADARDLPALRSIVNYNLLTPPIAGGLTSS